MNRAYQSACVTGVERDVPKSQLSPFESIKSELEKGQTAVGFPAAKPFFFKGTSDTAVAMQSGLWIDSN